METGFIANAFSGAVMLGIYGLVLLAVLVLGWFLWNRFMDFPLKVNLWQRRGRDRLKLHKTRGRLEKQKDGNYLLRIKGVKAYSALFDYKNIDTDEEIDVYMPGPNEFRPCKVTMIDKTQKVVTYPKEGEPPHAEKVEIKLVGKEVQIEPQLTPEMMQVFTSTILSIHMLTNPNEFFQTYGFVIYIIVAAVALILVLSPAIDATNQASAAMNSAAGAFKSAADALANTANSLESAESGGSGSRSTTGPAPPIFVVA